MELWILKLKNFLRFFSFIFFLNFMKWNFLVPSLKNSYIWNFLATRLETFLYIRKKLANPEKQTKRICSEKIPCLFIA